MMPLRPILSTLGRHKTAATLIVLEIALTCAIICNAIFLIFDRVDRLHLVTGLADDELVVLKVSSIRHDENAMATTAEDLARLRAIPGVRAATLVNSIPFWGSSQHSGISLTPDQVSPTVGASTYFGDTSALEALGLHLVAGRNFAPDEIVDARAVMRGEAVTPTAIVDQRTADRLFPGRSALGQVIYVWGKAPTRIVGVVERFMGAHPGQPEEGGPTGGFSVLFPGKASYNAGPFVLRTTTAQRAQVLKAAEAALDRRDAARILDNHALYTEMRAHWFRGDVTMVKLLLGVITSLLVVTAFGIVGLASFWVQQRTRMIGTRRALGATRAQIRHYFQAENLLLTTAGIVIGMVGAYGVNQWLMTQYELPRLPILYLPVGALALWALGQIAVLAPARRAAALPPALAMRGLG
jgi:putative ABC transport system permease protein